MNSFFVYIYDGGREHLATVDEDAFWRLRFYQAALKRGKVPDEVAADVSAVRGRANLIPSFSEDDIEAIPDSNFVRVIL